MKEETALQVQQPGNLLEIISQLANSPNALDKIEVMERLLAMQERVMADQRKTAFIGAMSRLQAVVPQIGKHGQGKNSKFAKYEDIDVIVRPMAAVEGFSITFDEESHTDKNITFVMTFSHREGHSEPKRLTVPVDAAASNREGKSIRPAIQDMGSTVSYARRYLLKMHLNLVERDEDTDGESRKTITDEQVVDLKSKIEEVGMDLGKFLVYMHVGELAEILVSDLKTAYNAIDVKRRNPK